MSPNDAMKDIERLIEAFEDDCLEDGENREAYRAEECKPSSSRHTSRAALLAAIGKLVSSTQPAMSQDAQPVAYVSEADMERLRANKWAVVEVSADETVDNGGNVPLYTHPPIPQEGKVLEALISAGQFIAWSNHGECRAYSDGPIPTSSQARERIDVALALLRSQVQGGLSTNNEEMK